MPISVSCDVCGRDYRIADEKAGTKFRCKECGETVEVPSGGRRGGGGPSRRSSAGGRSGRRRQSSSGGSSGALIAGIIGGVVLLLSGIGVGAYFLFTRGDAGGGGNAVANNNGGGTFAPGGQGVSVPTGGGGNNAASGGGSRFDTVDTGNGGGGNAGAGQAGRSQVPNNPDAGHGFGSVVGVVKQFTGPREDRAKLDYETLQEPPDMLPPRNWEYEPDPLPIAFEYEGAKKELHINVPRKSGIGSAEDIVFPVVPSPFVCVGPPGENEEREIWDISVGKRVAKIEGIAARTTAHALSPDGLFFAGMTRTEVGIWDVEQKAGSALISIEHSDYIAMPTNDRLVTTTWGHRKTMTVYEVPSGEKTGTVNLEDMQAGNNVIAFSPGGKYFAYVRSDFPNGNLIAIKELESGDDAGVLPTLDYSVSGGLNPVGMAFSQDGSELAVVYNSWSNSKLVIFDLVAPKVADHYTFEKTLSELALGHRPFLKAEPIVWFPGGRELLAFEHVLINRDAGGPVWEVPKSELDYGGKRRPIGKDHLTVIDNNPSRQASLFVYQLPEKQISQGIAAASQRKPEEPEVPATVMSPGKLTNRSPGGVSVAGGAVPWGLQPDAAPATADTRSIDLPNARGVPREIAISGGSKPKAAVLRGKEKLHWQRVPVGNVNPRILASHRSFARDKSRTDSSGGFDGNVASSGATGKRVWVDLYDLTSGERLQELKFDYDGDLLSISPEGSRFMVLNPTDGDRVDVFSTDNYQHIAGWYPFGRSNSNHDQSTFLVAAVLAGSNHVVALSGDGELACWSLPEVTPVFHTYKASQPAVSPTGKYVGYCDGSNYRFIETATGNVVGHIPDVGRVQAAAWQPSGGRVALLSEHKAGYYLFTVDVASGEISPPFPVPVISGHLSWCGDDYVLIDQSKLLDVRQKGVAWTYLLAQGDMIPVAGSSDVFYLAAGGARGRISRSELPTSGERSRLDGLDLTPNIVLKPGEACAVEYRLSHPSHDQGMQSEIKQLFERQLTEHNIKVDPAAPVKLIISSSETSGEQINQTYHRFGQGDEQVSYTAKSGQFRAAFEVGGQTAWQHTTNSGKGGFMVSTREGQTIEQSLEESYQGASKNAFQSFQLPPFVFSPESANGAGTTTLSAN
ncbi:MAG: hypothetical protein R3B90_02240 [Planctomycetaceae bacterium]